jgi:hypothetical protein
MRQWRSRHKYVLGVIDGGQTVLSHRAIRHETALYSARAGCLSVCTDQPVTHTDHSFARHGWPTKNGRHASAQSGGYASSHDWRVDCGLRSRGCSVRGARLTDGVACQQAGRLRAVRADLPGRRRRHRRCVRPQIPGLSPGGLGPHRTAFGSPAGFPPVSRLPAGLSSFVCLPLVSLRPAFSGLFPSAITAGSGSPSVSLRGPFPFSNPPR